jgi:hypothetical protein
MTRTRRTFLRNCGEGVEEPTATAIVSNRDGTAQAESRVIEDQSQDGRVQRCAAVG